MKTTPGQRVLAEHRRREAFSVWVDALRLRAVMRGIELDRITDGEWEEYDRPTVPFK
jgi:hypothetical protein